MSEWIRVCAAEEIDAEDLVRFDHGERTFCVYNTDKGFFATDGICTHEEEHLEYGIVIGTVIIGITQGFDSPARRTVWPPGGT